jgi:hypothetical protein
MCGWFLGWRLIHLVKFTNTIFFWPALICDDKCELMLRIVLFPMLIQICIFVKTLLNHMWMGEKNTFGFLTIHTSLMGLAPGFCYHAFFPSPKRPSSCILAIQGEGSTEIASSILFYLLDCERHIL